MTRNGYKQSAEHIAARIRRGPAHYAWLGDAVSEKGGRSRARRLYPEVGPCALCGSEAAERHHRDGNTANNLPDNVVPLCRGCHMAGDGRLEALLSRGRANISGMVASSAAKRRAAATCKRGHPLSGRNLHVNPMGSRVCRLCRQAHTLAYRKRMAARG